SARATHYLESQAEIDYAALSASLVETLNQVALTNEAPARLDIVRRARQALAEWPQNHFNYRQAEVRQMIVMLDEAISDLQAASGTNRIDLSFVAVPEGVAREPLLPEPTVQQSIEQILTAARTVDNSAERTDLLSTALGALDGDIEALPPGGVGATRPEMESAIRTELRIDRSYRTLTKTMMAVADSRARLADVRGLERLLTRVNQRDRMLG